MKKTLMIAAALLTLGAGSAFAEGSAEVQQAQVSHTQAAQQSSQQSSQHQTVFATTTQRPTVSVYGLFGEDGGPQGGQQ
ncbi:MAG: hypothetical protein P4L71_06810 [Acetobacteraceae bacterium]|nr:hypothetical protein [Acetobacteraceae bacterium]